MAEFPGLGSHCSHEECHRLDFLPIKCHACTKMFCLRHFAYEDHNCSSGLRTDVQVPVCPLCNKPVPTGKNEVADVVVGQHIDNDCQSDPARKKRAYVNLCSLKTCKRRELVPVVCSECGRNFCLKHRHDSDHECRGRAPNPLLRPNIVRPSANITAADLKNDEELARRLQESWGRGKAPETDAEMAARLQREEYAWQERPVLTQGHGRRLGTENCILS